MNKESEEVVIDEQPEKITVDLRRFNKAEAAVKKALDPLKLILAISDKAGVEAATEHLKNAKLVESVVEAKRTSIVKPRNDEVTRVNAYAKALVKDVPGEMTRVKNLIIAYNKKVEAEQKKERTNNRVALLLSMGLTFDGLSYSTGKIIITENEIGLYEDAVWFAVLDKVKIELEAAKNIKLETLNKQLEGASFFGEDDSVEIKQQIKAIQEKPETPLQHVPSFGGGGSSSHVKGMTKKWTFEILNIHQVPREYLMVDEKAIRASVTSGTRSIDGVRIFQEDGFSLR